MKLTSLVPQLVGPFSTREQITFEPNVTVLTGQNDTGKSRLLDLLSRVARCGHERALGEEDVNFDYLTTPIRDWQTDTTIGAAATFQALPAHGGQQILAQYQLAPKCWHRIGGGYVQLNGAQRNLGAEGGLLQSFLPRPVFIPAVSDGLIRPQISLAEPAPVEKALLRVAFEHDVSAGAFASLSSQTHRITVRKAADRLNERLAAWLPPSLRYRFSFESHDNQKDVIFIGLEDDHGALTSLGHRGAGVQKMVQLLGTLAAENVGEEPTLLLLDEPETSLHADAQHSLRFALEELGKLDTVQVVYATHSPSMINPMRPEAIRLLRRVRTEGGGTTCKVEAAPIKESFLPVRLGLGLSPADSLLYAPVTVLVEGESEALCLPLLFRRLHAEGGPDWKDALTLLGCCHFVEAKGSHYDVLRRFAKSQGSRPIILVDGDVEKRVRAQLKSHLAEVPLLTLPPGQEFEDLIERDTYFAALAEVLGLDPAAVTTTAYEAWTVGAGLPEGMMFSKRIKRWVKESFKKDFVGKPVVMLAACRQVPLEKLNVSPLRELVKTVRDALARSPHAFTEP